MTKNNKDILTVISELSEAITEFVGTHQHYSLKEHRNDVDFLLSYILQTSSKHEFNYYLAHNIAEGNVSPEAEKMFEFVIKELRDGELYPMPTIIKKLDLDDENLTDDDVKEYVRYLKLLKSTVEDKKYLNEIEKLLANFGEDEKSIAERYEWEKQNGTW
ncbi:hypothetical protein [Metabacillus halosaccharovorans]|uniref:hypothetical protein n=1 Tax=Metabacillus halosaccharovorans TaxID=930124 RepID=UPI00203B2DFF|nr:hypothetical protein [Metabacillus halosaccharovorans]MCM3444358.1 hypothetical protein [Metabacillus halosaccharovorans]